MRFSAILLLLLGLGLPALASDGVLEINQICAINTGCFSGDTPGFPVTINGSAGRSYRLTGDLVVPDINTDGIVVSSSTISIDLSGFEIVGSGCEGAASSCTPASGTGSGIEAGGSIFHGLSVKNGSVSGMGSFGVILGDQGDARNLRVRWNAGIGILAGSGSIVLGNTSFQNGLDGINGGSGSTITANACTGNARFGILAGRGSMISSNSVTASTLDGILAPSGATIIGNTISGSGGDGIQTGDFSLVQQNAISQNSGVGLNLFGSTAYRDNVIISNTAGTVTGGVEMGGNSCNGTTTCP